MANPQVVVEFLANTQQLSQGMRDAQGTTKGFGASMKSTARVAVAAAGAAGIGALVSILHTGVEEMNQAAKVGAQTQAVIKSTGGAAGVTAKQVEDLAGALMQKTGVDDEAIQSGENLLLTFTNIRNEAGKGNDIFNQATTAMLDMSVALGQDASQSAIQLGKALNDPIKGVTALRRVGVSFTDAQLDQIKAMTEAGDTMGAQKLILAELTKEFGGSAEAAGKTLPGELSVLQESYKNVAGELAKTLAPMLKTVADLFIKYPGLMKAVVIGVIALSAAMVALNAVFVITSIVTAPISVWFIAIPVLIAAVIAAAILLWRNWDTVTKAMVTAFNALKAAAMAVFNWLKANWPLIAGILAGPLGIAAVQIARHWDKIEGAARAAVGAVKGALNGLVNFLEGLVARVGRVMSSVADAIKAPINAVIGAWNALSFTVPTVHLPGFPGVKVAGKEIVPGWGGTTIGGGSWSFPDIPKLAAGGIVTRPTLAVVGEAGPEAVLPLGGAGSAVNVRVYIGDTELRGLVRAEVTDVNTGIARTLLAGAR